ncbi:MAG: PQQ-dependent sugar dehydrogenase [Pseudomonadota bacterium]
MFRSRLTPFALSILTLALAGAPSTAETVTEQSEIGPIQIETVTSGLESPWAMAFLPDGRFLVTERGGAMRIVNGDTVGAPLSGLPDIADRGQGGLLDVALAPDFATSNMILFSYSEPALRGIGTAVSKATLTESGLANVERIFSMNNKSFGGRHFGSRLAFAPDGTLFITTGDRGEPNRSQDGSDHAGSVIRINLDGSAPADNPSFSVPATPVTWSIGHRNPQSAAINPTTGVLWTVEHGARGGDEVNIPQAGLNYGWPIISYGREYSGGKIGIGTEAPGYEQPIHYWDPSIAPSGMAFGTNLSVPEWQSSLFVGALRGAHISRLSLDGDRIVGEEQILESLGERIRDVRIGPDGALYALTDSPEGRILRITPDRQS